MKNFLGTNKNFEPLAMTQLLGRSVVESPELRLLEAMLADAILTIQEGRPAAIGNRGTVSGRKNEYLGYRDAVDWFFYDDDPERLWGFYWVLEQICCAYGADVSREAVRDMLMPYRERNQDFEQWMAEERDDADFVPPPLRRQRYYRRRTEMITGGTRAGPSSTLSGDEVRAVRRMGEAGETATEISRALGHKVSVVRGILSGRNYTHVS